MRCSVRGRLLHNRTEMNQLFNYLHWDMHMCNVLTEDLSLPRSLSSSLPLALSWYTGISAFSREMDNAAKHNLKYLIFVT